MQTRRQAIGQSAVVAGLLGATGLFAPFAFAYSTGAFAATSVPDVLKALGARTVRESSEVSISAPNFQENGALVPVEFATSLQGAKTLLLLVEKNPSTLAAMFGLNASLEAAFSMRIKLAESSDVYAVALMPDGSAFFAKTEVTVVMGGCG